MIREMFKTAEPLYISIHDREFTVKDRCIKQLEVTIQDVFPVRKLFIDARLVCFSFDSRTGKNGQYCALCPNRFRCHRRIRLMLLLQNVEPEPVPAVLEIGPASFDALDELIGKIGPELLHNTLVTIGLSATVTNRPAIEFKPLF